MVCQKISLHAQICQPLPLHSLIFGYPNLFHYFLNGITNGTSVLNLYHKWYLSFTYVSQMILRFCWLYNKKYPYTICFSVLFWIWPACTSKTHVQICINKHVQICTSTNMSKMCTHTHQHNNNTKYVHQQTWTKCVHMHINTKINLSQHMNINLSFDFK
jgi:hypothetical protein